MITFERLASQNICCSQKIAEKESKKTMPSWLKKRFQVLKSDLINHLAVERSKKQVLTPTVAICDTNNAINSNQTAKVPIQKIRNDLRTTRFRSKTNINAYHDYAQWRDQVLISQNNCALRCIKEEKINNTDKLELMSSGTLKCNDTESNNVDSRQHKTESNVLCASDCDAHGDVDSESEFACATDFCLPIESILNILIVFLNNSLKLNND